jgi:ubiquitin related modifier 1
MCFVVSWFVFSGGLEMLFENKKAIDIHVDASPFSMKDLIEELRAKHLREKEEMFIAGGSVRPGIIVLINDTDWELEDTTSYQLQAGDRVAFISTLHGG